MSERKMATIQIINGIFPIPNADRICQYGILGWNVVDQVGKYQVGDLVVFLEVNSFSPHTLTPFLTRPEKFPQVYMGVEGQRLRTVRLRGALSQGLILPMTVLAGTYTDADIGTDVGELLGVVKWEAPPEYNPADARGLFPDFIPKTDQERIQNCCGFIKSLGDVTAEVQEKLEGQSHTAYLNAGEFGVCSRNLNLRDSDNTFWNTARKFQLEEKLRGLGRNLAIQSEQVGPGIQNNIYGLTEHRLYVFDIWDIDEQRFLEPEERRALVAELGLIDAPLMSSKEKIGGRTVAQFLKLANGKSVLGFTNTLREGLVYKINGPRRVSFKTISDEYLLKYGD